MNEHHTPIAEPTDDGELVRYLDGELDALARSRVEQRLASDPAAAGRLESLRVRGGRLRRLLAAADSAPAAHGRTLGKPRSRRTPLLRAAAIIVAVGAAALLAPPVRAFVAETLARIAAGFQSASGPSAGSGSGTSADRGADPPLSEFGTRFHVETSEFRIEVASTQAAGTLTLRRGAGPDGAADIVGSAGDAELLVADGVLRIVNGRAATASYTVVLPAAIGPVRVRIGSSPAAEIALEHERIIDLRPH